LEVKAQAMIECRGNVVVIGCSSTTLDGYQNASTPAAIGKATLMIEEEQNWGQK
jgi:hypothetical protein